MCYEIAFSVSFKIPGYKTLYSANDNPTYKTNKPMIKHQAASVSVLYCNNTAEQIMETRINWCFNPNRSVPFFTNKKHVGVDFPPV